MYPALTWDIDGKSQPCVTLPQIFVDDCPSTLSLDQIPADAIATVE